MILTLVGVLASACASAPQEAFDLKDFLGISLDTHEVQVGVPVDLVFRIQNLKIEPLDICFTDSGVSTWLQSPRTRQMLPVAMQGLTTDVRCAKVVHIAGSDSLILHERVTIPTEWAGAARSLVLGGSFRASIDGAKGPIDDRNATIRTPLTDVAVRDPGASR